MRTVDRTEIGKPILKKGKRKFVVCKPVEIVHKDETVVCRRYCEALARTGRTDLSVFVNVIVNADEHKPCRTFAKPPKEYDIGSKGQNFNSMGIDEPYMTQLEKDTLDVIKGVRKEVVMEKGNSYISHR